jgi:hypothetical protein
LSCGRIVHRVEKSNVLMEDTCKKDFSKSTCDLNFIGKESNYLRKRTKIIIQGI